MCLVCHYLLYVSGASGAHVVTPLRNHYCTQKSCAVRSVLVRSLQLAQRRRGLRATAHAAHTAHARPFACTRLPTPVLDSHDAVNLCAQLAARTMAWQLWFLIDDLRRRWYSAWVASILFGYAVVPRSGTRRAPRGVCLGCVSWNEYSP